MCVKLYNYLDFRQGSRGHPVRGDQVIADALGCQARTVRTHGGHLAGGGLIRIDKFVTERGAHKATQYEVIHNPGRKRFNENATTPLLKRRARPRSSLTGSGKLGLVNRQNVARQTRHTSAQEDCETGPLRVARSTRDPHRDVGREPRDDLGTQEGNQEKNSAFSCELDPDGDVADASEEILARAPVTQAPPTNEATLECLFAEDMSEDLDWLSFGAQSGTWVGMTEDEAVAALMRVFPGAELVTA
jgi:hypothetical protein